MAIRAGDIVRARIRKLHVASTADGPRRLAELRLCHLGKASESADYRADRWWSWCDLTIELPEDRAPPAASGAVRPEALRLGAEVDLVLAVRADASRVADAPGNYSCRLHAASEAPTIPIERPVDSVYSGLIERTEPPAGGDLVLHLGSGLTAYVELAGSGPFPPESLEHGSWSEFILMEPFGVAHWKLVGAG